MECIKINWCVQLAIGDLTISRPPRLSPDLVAVIALLDGKLRTCLVRIGFLSLSIFIVDRRRYVS